METNISEKLQLCRNCKNRKFDKTTGLVCGLTGSKPTFDAECLDYVADEATIEIDREREIELNSRESGIRGWLAFFIWVGVIGGAVGSVIIGIRLLTENTFGLAYSIVYGIMLAVLMLTAVLTCIAFYSRSSNAVSLAKTYIVMIALDGISYAIICMLTRNTSEIAQVFRQISWSIIWYLFLVTSQDVGNQFPVDRRKCGVTEKILLSIYVAIELFYIGGCVYLAKSDNPKNLFFKDDVYFDATISNTQASLPIDYGNGVLLTGIKKNGYYTVVFEYTLTDVDSRILDLEIVRASSISLKYAYLSNIEENDDNFIETCFKLKRNLEYRYLDKFKTFIYSFSISPEEYYYSKNLADGEWICPKKVLEEQIATEKATYPTAFSSDSEYINVTLSEDNKELTYEIKLNPMEQDEWFALTSSDLLNYVTENWANDATPLRKLAEMDGLIITYHFTTASRTDFRTIKVGPETYSQL